MPKQPIFKLFKKRIEGRLCWEVNVPAKYNGGKRGRRRFWKREEGLDFCADQKELRNTVGPVFLDLPRTFQLGCVEGYKRLKAAGKPFDALSIFDKWIADQTEENT